MKKVQILALSMTAFLGMGPSVMGAAPGQLDADLVRYWPLDGEDGFGNRAYKMLWEDISSFDTGLSEISGTECLKALNQKTFAALKEVFLSNPAFGLENSRRVCSPGRFIMFSTYNLCNRYALAHRYADIMRETRDFMIIDTPADYLIRTGEIASRDSTTELRYIIRNYAVTQAGQYVDELLLGKRIAAATQLYHDMLAALQGIDDSNTLNRDMGTLIGAVEDWSALIRAADVPPLTSDAAARTAALRSVADRLFG